MDQEEEEEEETLDSLGDWISQCPRRCVSVSEPLNEQARSIFLGGVPHVTFRVSSRIVRRSSSSSVRRRMSDFVALRDSLLRRFDGIVLPPPESGVLGGALSDPTASRGTSTARRTRALSAFAETVCASPFLSQDAVTVAFFELSPYAEWDALRKLIATKGASEARSARQACERARCERFDSSGPQRWVDALQSKSALELPVVLESTYASVEDSAREVAKAAREAASLGAKYASALAKLASVVEKLGREERDTFRGRAGDYGAQSLDELSEQCLKPLAEETFSRADAIERYLGAPMREEATYMAACRELSRKKELSDWKTTALGVETERLAPKFAATCRACKERTATSIHHFSVDVKGISHAATEALQRRESENDVSLAINSLGLNKQLSPYGFLRSDAEQQVLEQQQQGQSVTTSRRPMRKKKKSTKKATTNSTQAKSPEPSSSSLEMSEPSPKLADEEFGKGEEEKSLTRSPRPPPPSRPRSSTSFLADIRGFDSTSLLNAADSPPSKPQSPPPGGGISLMSEMMARRRSHLSVEEDD